MVSFSKEREGRLTYIPQPASGLGMTGDVRSLAVDR
jgi:hypothetical protein